MNGKHLLGLLFATALLSALCAGCGNNYPAPGSDTETPAVEETNVEDAPVDIQDTQETQFDVLSAYAPALNEICDGIYNGCDFETEYEYLPMEIVELAIIKDRNYMMENIGWTVRDISGDGVPELLVGAIPDGHDEEETVGLVYGGYTLQDGKIIRFLESWERGQYQWLGSGRFYQFVHGGSTSLSSETCHISPDGTELQCEDFYFIEPLDSLYGEDITQVIGVFHNTTGEWETEQSEHLSTSYEAFWGIDEELAKQCQQLELTPLAQYPYTRNAAG